VHELNWLRAARSFDWMTPNYAQERRYYVVLVEYPRTCRSVAGTESTKGETRVTPFDLLLHRSKYPSNIGFEGGRRPSASGTPVPGARNSECLRQQPDRHTLSLGIYLGPARESESSKRLSSAAVKGFLDLPEEHCPPHSDYCF